MNLSSPLWLPLIHVASLNYNLLKKSVGFIIIHLVDLRPICAISLMGVTFISSQRSTHQGTYFRITLKHIDMQLWYFVHLSLYTPKFFECQIANLWECKYNDACTTNLATSSLLVTPFHFSRRQLMMVIMFVHLILACYRSQLHSCWTLGNVKTLLYFFYLALASYKSWLTTRKHVGEHKIVSKFCYGTTK